MNINQKINLRMAGLIATYIITKNPEIRNILPANCKTKARYNTCYDLVRPTVPLSEINKFINEGSERSKTYLKNNLSRNKYLKILLVGTPMGIQVVHSLTNERPLDYLDLERTGAVKFIESKDVELR